MLKKIAVILLILIYGSATMGATVHLHYCMNEFVGWSLFHSKNDTCGKCGMKEKDKGGCCKDEHLQYKLKVDQQKNSVGQCINLITTPTLSVPVIDIDIHSYHNVTESYPSCHAPPAAQKERLNIFYCVFLI